MVTRLKILGIFSLTALLLFGCFAILPYIVKLPAQAPFTTTAAFIKDYDGLIFKLEPGIMPWQNTITAKEGYVIRTKKGKKSRSITIESDQLYYIEKNDAIAAIVAVK